MHQIDENVQREIINHRSLRHPNIVRFKEVIYPHEPQRHLRISVQQRRFWDRDSFAVRLDTKGSVSFTGRLSFFLMPVQVMLTPTHLAIVMEYAAGGELFERICNAGRFSEDEVSVLSSVNLFAWRVCFLIHRCRFCTVLQEDARHSSVLENL